MAAGFWLVSGHFHRPEIGLQISTVLHVNGPLDVLCPHRDLTKDEGRCIALEKLGKSAQAFEIYAQSVTPNPKFLTQISESNK